MATTARNKVVRVEDYELKEASDDDMTKLLVPAGETDINERIIHQLPSRENTVSDASNNNALEVVPTSAMDVSEVSTDEEDDDELGQLPDGWPKIPQIFERKSWDFCSTVSPSVNKAASHLELLQGIIEEWFKETNSEYESRASSKRTVPSRPVTVHSQSTIKLLHLLPLKRKIYHLPSVTRQDTRASRDVKRLRFFASPESHDESVDFLRSISSVHDHQQELSVHGIGAKAEPAALEYELPYLGADEVLDEVVTLLAKLENDRQETRDKLKNERERSRTLSQKIDQHCMRKLKEIPQAVQAEHEACANDISELNWHVTCEARNEEKIRKDCTAAESLNLKLKEDIEFIKGHIPLVAEKLELEKEAMARINQAQKDTDDELNLTKNRCAKVKAKSDDAHKKAEEERAAIKKDLDNVKDDLSRITEELSKAKMTYNYYIHQTNDYRTQIHDNAQELQVLAVKHENAKSAECIQDTKVKNVLAKVKQAEYEQRTLEEENEELDNDKEWKKRKQAEILEERRQTIENQKDRRKMIGRKNKELDIDLEDLQFKLKELDKHKVADEKNLERMIRELERTEQQYDTVLQELAQINLINVSTRQQLQEEEDRTLQAEEQLRSVADSLKRQVKEEIHSKAVLTAKITSDSGDTEQLEEESTIKKEKVTKMADEVEGAVKAVSKKVEKLRNAKKDRDKKIGELRRQVETFESLHTEMLETSEKEKSTLNPDHSTLSELRDKVAQLDKKIDKMNKQRDMMTKKKKVPTATLR